MIKSVFLDLDDTILDFRKAEAIAIKQTFIDLGIDYTDELIKRYSKINLSQWKLLEKGELTRETLLTQRFDILYSELGLDISSRKTQALYEEYLSRGAYYIDGAENVLKDICGKYDLYIASNGTAYVQNRRIAISGIDKYFKAVFISEYIGFDKPSREFFKACFAEIPDFKWETAIIVGDSLSSDILGGKNAGIKTCWFNPKNEQKDDVIRADYEINKLSLLPKLLEEI